MKKAIRNIITFSDQILTHSYLSLICESKALISFYLHGLLLDEREESSHVVDPDSQRGLTVAHLRQLMEYFLRNNYVFVSPQDVLAGLDPGSNYIMLTFDDGYYNNIHALPVLREYRVPAVFFISTNNVLYNKGFWWDVLFREGKKAGAPKKELCKEAVYLKSRTNEQIEQHLRELFGQGAFDPVGDIDRPFTPDELKSFSREEHVVLGNHTSDHGILTNYTPDGVRRQITQAQDTIFEITGKRPVAISYPSGKYSREVFEISREAGLKLGLTINPGRNYLPITVESDSTMGLCRFTLSGDSDLLRQFECARSDISLYRTAKGLMDGFRAAS